MNEMDKEYYKNVFTGKLYVTSKKRSEVRIALKCYKRAFELKGKMYDLQTVCSLLNILGKYSEFEEYCLKGIELGFKPFYHYLGQHFLDVKKGDCYDLYKGLFWLTEGTKHKDLYSFYELGKLYIYGAVGVQKDYDVAEKHLTAGLKVNTSENKGILYYYLGMVKYETKQYDEAFALFNQAIRFGYNSAYNYLALCYKNGWGTEKDIYKYLDTLLCWIDKNTAKDIGGEFLLGEFLDKNNSIAKGYFALGSRYGDPTSSIMYASLLAKENPIDELRLEAVLERAFINAVDDDRFKESLDEIIEIFGEERRELIEKLAEKYWYAKRNLA